MLIICNELQHWYKISHSCYYLYIFPHVFILEGRMLRYSNLIVIEGHDLYLQLMSSSLQKPYKMIIQHDVIEFIINNNKEKKLL